MNKFFCISALVCLASLAVAEPPSAWNTKASAGWNAGGSQRSGWRDEKVGVKSSEGQGWVSSESTEDFRPQSIPTSWQKVQKQNGDWVKSSGWDEKKANNGWDKSALNPPSQEIAKGLIVKHPLPTLKLSSWTPSPLSADAWNKDESVEEWQRDAEPAGWEKAASAEQWQQKQASTNAWQKDSSFERNSASRYAAADAASAQYQKQAALNAWQKKEASSNGWEKKSNTNAWQKDASSEEVWQKESAPAAWSDVPAGWEKEAAASSAAANGWDADSDFSAWQKETATNGWDKDAAAKAWQKDSAASGWEKDAALNAWQKDSAIRNAAASNAWQKDAPSAASAWNNARNNNNKNEWQSATQVYNDKKARGPAPSKWVK